MLEESKAQRCEHQHAGLVHIAHEGELSLCYRTCILQFFRVQMAVSTLCVYLQMQGFCKVWLPVTTGRGWQR
jgi:hypothetical protein